MTDPNDEYLIRAVFLETVDNFAIFRRNPNGCSGVQGKGDRKKQKNGKEKKGSLTHKLNYEMKFCKVQGGARFDRPHPWESRRGFTRRGGISGIRALLGGIHFLQVKRNPIRGR
jgi:hypothetical protein